MSKEKTPALVIGFWRIKRPADISYFDEVAVSFYPRKQPLWLVTQSENWQVVYSWEISVKVAF